MTAGVVVPRSAAHAVEHNLQAGAGDCLDDIFAEPHAKLVAWRKDAIQASYSGAQRGMRGLLRERSRLEELSGDLAALEQERQGVLRLRAESEQLGHRVRQSAEAAARRADGVRRTREVIDRAQEECRQRLPREQEALADRRRAAERRGAEVDALLGLYSERLGLRCERVAPQTVRMVFTLVDPSEPAREFSFSLGLDESFEYSAFGCRPDVRDLDERVARLNSEGHSKCALPAFLCGMRQAFRAGCAARDR